MYRLQDETRMQAVVRFNRDGGNEADYIRSVPLQMADGTTETLAHCQICRAHLENGVIKHLFYCPFEGAADRLRDAAPLMLAALEAIQEAFVNGEIKFTKVRQADSDPYHPANVKLAVAIAAARGQ